MAIPSKKEIGDIILKFLNDGRPRAFSGITTQVKNESNMSAEELKKKNKGGSQAAWIYRTDVVLKELKRGGMVEITPGNRYRITDAGRQSLSNDDPNDASRETIEPGASRNIMSTSDPYGQRLHSAFATRTI